MKVMIITNDNGLKEVFLIKENSDKDKAMFKYVKDIEDYINTGDEDIMDALKNDVVEGFYNKILSDYLPNFMIDEYNGIDFQPVIEFN